MDSLDTILKNLRKVASDNQYEGPAINALISLIGNGVYINTLNAISTVLEASPTRCKLVNSAIQHAKDRGYSVYRGRNQYISIKSAQVTKSVRYNKYDQVAKVGKFYLLASMDYNLVEGQSIDDLRLIVSTSPPLIEEVVGNNSLSIHTSLTSNYSEDIDIYEIPAGDNKDPILLSYSEYKRDVLRDYSIAKDGSGDNVKSPIDIWLTTSTDYGIELYMFDRSLLTIANIGIYKIPVTDQSATNNSNQDSVAQVIAEISRFKGDSTYKFMGIEYTNEGIDDVSIIKSIPGIRYDINNIELINGNNRIIDVQLINASSDLINISNNIVRTSYELKSIVKSELMRISPINSCKVVYNKVFLKGSSEDGTSVDLSNDLSRGILVGTYLDSNTGNNEYIAEEINSVSEDTSYGNGQLGIVIYVVSIDEELSTDKDKDPNKGITLATFRKLLSNIKSAYYVSDLIYVVKPISHIIRYEATLHNSNLVNVNDISRSIENEFNYRIGEVISLNEIDAYIINNYPSVRYVERVSIDNGNTIPLNSNEYSKLDVILALPNT